MKNKRIIPIIFIILLSAIIFQYAEAFGATVMENKQWVFLFWDYEVINDELTQDNITIIGRDNGITHIDEDKGALMLGQNGSTGKACMKFRVKGTCRLRFLVCSSSKDLTSTLAISDGTQTVGEITAPNNSTGRKTVEFDYIGGEKDLYIYSKNRAVYVYITAVVYDKIVMGDVTGSGSVTEEDAALVLKHITGSGELTDRLKYADIDTNGKIDARDVVGMLLYMEESQFGTETSEVDTSDGTVVSSSNGLAIALNRANAKVYVTDDIEMGSRLTLTKGGQSIIGVPKADGSLPVLDFKDMAEDNKEGIKIRSSNNTIENIVVENAHDNGILLKRESSNELITGNTIKNCILRYNNDSGLQITKCAYNNTIENVISYRNCDVYTRGSNADGFAVKMGAGIENTEDSSAIAKNANTFINCYAWENGDDAWDSYDKPGQDSQTYNVVYKNCMCWGNGTPAIHLGYTDYINGLELDEKLPFMRHIAADDPTGYERFKKAYNNRTLCSASASREEYGAAADALLSKKISTDAGELTIAQLLDDSRWAGNPNGFKLGSAYTETICQRSLTNCIAFDHEKKGFDKNNAACDVSLKNCISFDNNRNYKLDEMNITGYENIYGWDGSSDDNMPNGYSIETPAARVSIEGMIRRAAQAMVGYAAQNKIGRTDIFERAMS